MSLVQLCQFFHIIFTIGWNYLWKKVVKLERFQDNTDSYNLCYNTTSKQSKFPSITVHFNGVDVKLDSKGTFDSLYEGVKWFAFRTHKNGLGLFENMTQINYLVGYDLNKNIFFFQVYWLYQILNAYKDWLINYYVIFDR